MNPVFNSMNRKQMQSRHWKRPHEPVQNNTGSKKSAGKRMDSISWDRDGILLKDCPPRDDR